MNAYIVIFLVFFLIFGCWYLNVVFGDGVYFRQNKNKKVLDAGFKAIDRNDELRKLYGTEVFKMEEYKKNEVIINDSLKESDRLTDANIKVYDSW